MSDVAISTIGKLNWAILPISCVMIGFCYLDRSNIAYMQLQLREPPPIGLGFSDILYGQGSGLFFVGYSMFQIPSNLVLTRVGAPLWLTIIVVLWGVCATAMAAMRSPVTFLVLRFFLGLFEAGTFPGIWYHMALFYPNTEMTVPISATTAAVMASQVLSAPVAAALMGLDGQWGLAGWRWLCLIEGGATVLVGLSLFVFLPLKPASIPSLTAQEQAYISKHVSRPPSAQQLLRGLAIAVRSLDLWKLSFVHWTKACAVYSLMFWTPLVINDLLGPSNKHDPNLPILLTAIPYAFAAAFTMFIGYSSQARSERKIHTAAPFAAAGAVLVIAPALKGAWAAVPSFIALCVGLSFANATGPLTAMVLSTLPPQAQSGGLALWNSVANLGGYVGPALFGLLKARTGTHAAGFVVMGVILLMGASVMLLFDEAAAVARAALQSGVPAPTWTYRDDDGGATDADGGAERLLELQEVDGRKGTSRKGGSKALSTGDAVDAL